MDSSCFHLPHSILVIMVISGALINESSKAHAGPSALPSDVQTNKVLRTKGDDGIQPWTYLQVKEPKENPRYKSRPLMSVNKLLAAQDEVINFENGDIEKLSDEDQLDLTAAQNDTIQSYIRKNCTSCLEREEAKLSRIHQIKKDILSKLGLKKAPNVTSRSLPLKHNSPLNYITKKYNMQRDEPTYPHDSESDVRAKTERIYAFGTNPPQEWNIPSDSSVVYFKFSDQTTLLDVEKARLHVYVQTPKVPATGSRVQQLVAEIYRITDVTNPKKVQKTDLIMKKFTHNLEHGHWQRFNVKKIVEQWFLKQDLNFGIIIKINYKGENLAVLPSEDTNDDAHNTYLDILTRDGARSRQKRDSLQIDCTIDQESRCCRHPLIIDFQSFGWDWVVAPKRYMAYYCAGKCPRQYIQQYIHTHLAEEAGVGPCCTPADMTDMLMIYFTDDYELRVSKVPGMVVTRCGCA